MTYYHQSKQLAVEAGGVFESHFIVRAELEPYNGWVIVLQPLGLHSFEFPLADILSKAEIDLTGFERLRKRPGEYKRPPTEAPKAPRAAAAAAKAEEDIKATWKPGAALPWAR